MASEVLENFKEKKIFGGLDGLRFLSIVAVVWHHSTSGIEWLKLTSRGFLGVDLFFVISGFLIVSLLLREKDNTGNISLRKFYIRRSLRIFPLYYGFILGLAALYFLFNKDSEFGQSLIRELPIYLLYLSNFFPVILGLTWSLASEEQFYLLWPFLEKHFSKFIFYILLVAILVNQAVNFYRVSIFDMLGMSHMVTLSIMHATFTPILLGVLLAHILHKKIAVQWLLPLIEKKGSAVLWFVLLLVLMQLSPDDISGFPRLAIQVAMVLLVGAVVIREDHHLNRFLTLTPVARIGAISYGIYLFHIHGIMIAKKSLGLVGVQNGFVVFITSMLITVIAAEVSFRFFEMPFLRLKSKFSTVHQKHI